MAAKAGLALLKQALPAVWAELHRVRGARAPHVALFLVHQWTLTLEAVKYACKFLNTLPFRRCSLLPFSLNVAQAQ